MLTDTTQSVYTGFDPTAPSLHIGNLSTLVTLLHFQAGGFKPIILLGGATGLIGDPSGRESERKQLDREEVEGNIDLFKCNLDSVVHNIYCEEYGREYFRHLNK